ncbi:MAG: 16S rRNA (uracil(1498)-N(3))-methyltransferase, partial [Alphaproteobacteria bacterium]|nr:16S rRNA (uracil(1498)-N(3))-methyltransferase [Alphaproteobacteria bacterium]
MSSIPRLFVNSDLVAGTAFALDEEQAKYLTRVMRLGLGDGARVFNGRDGEWRAEISEITGRRAEVTPVEQLREQPS